MTLLGLVADTHGRLRPEALAALEGSDLLLHAGDVGRPEILDELRRLAPVHAVRGNVDGGAWAEALPLHLSLDVEGLRLLLHHGHLEPPPEGVSAAQVIVQGHSHRPEIVRGDDGSGPVLRVNPGSAGPRRFRLPVTVARLRIDRDRAEAELVELP